MRAAARRLSRMSAPALFVLGCGAEAPDEEQLSSEPSAVVAPVAPSAGTHVAPAPMPTGDPFGFSAKLEAALSAHAEAGPPDLRALAPEVSTLPFQPMKARYLDTILRPRVHEVATSDGLDSAEQDALRRNGFVVSERLASTSFGEGFLDVYRKDQPVFISADAILHAWHRSFDDTLKEIETSFLIPQLMQVLAGMQGSVPGVASDIRGNATMAASLDDADVFLAVARSLLDGTPATSARGQVARTQELLDAISAGSRADVELFGRPRAEDFSQFKPRGHYTATVELQRYFRASMWLGREDMRVAGPSGDPRELGAALVLQELLVRSAQVDALGRIDHVMAGFVGPVDSMTFDDIAALRALAGATSLGQVDDAALAALGARIQDTTLGAQLIQSHPYETVPGAVVRLELPRSFTFLGQRFTVDGWATSQLVYDRIQVHGAPVERELPSGVDVAFTTFHNDAAADVLADRIASTSGQPGRDGLAIAAQLLAVRDAVDAAAPALWSQNAYGHWMLALRALSEPHDGPTFSVARTTAWQRRVMQGQLASWAELRHDTILYVKQPETMGATCEYPAGYVEPNVAFWEAMGGAARSMATMLGSLGESSAGDEARMLGEQRAFFNGFAGIVDSLGGIARKQDRQKPLSSEEVQLLKDVMIAHEHAGTGGGCGGSPAWTGYTSWYPKLYLGGALEALDPDALVADVHSSERVNLIVATAAVDRLVVVVDNGPDLMAYSGPVSSYYEWSALERLTDLEWQRRLEAGREPARESWTGDWLVPAQSIVRRMLVDDDGDAFAHGSGADRSDDGNGLGAPLGGQELNLGLVHAVVETGDETGIGLVVKKRTGMFRSCAEDGWKRVPQIEGRVSLGWSIVDGKAVDVHVVSNQAGDDTVAHCFVTGVRALRFAPETNARVAEWGLELTTGIGGLGGE